MPLDKKVFILARGQKSSINRVTFANRFENWGFSFEVNYSLSNFETGDSRRFCGKFNEHTEW